MCIPSGQQTLGSTVASAAMQLQPSASGYTPGWQLLRGKMGGGGGAVATQPLKRGQS